MDARPDTPTGALLDGMTDAFVHLDASWRCTYANPAAGRLFGAPADALHGRSLWDLLPQPAGAPLASVLRRAMETRTPAEAEGFAAPLDRWLVCHLYPTADGLSILLRDVTARRAAEAAAHRSGERFRALADAAPVLIWIADPAKGRTYFNQGWLAFTGRTLAEEQGDGWADGLHPDDRDRVRRTAGEAFEARTPFQMEYRLRHHDGSFRWLLDYGKPLYDADGSFTGYIGCCVDIDDRRKIEEQLAFVATAGAVLTSSLDYTATLQAVADLMVPRLADWCGVDVLGRDGKIQRVAVAHVDPEKVRWAHELHERYPIDPDAPRGVPQVIRSGKAEFYPHIPEELLRNAAQDEEHWKVIQQIGFRSVLVVPLNAREQTLGALTLVWSDSDRHYTEADLQFAEELARRAGIMVDNARLYDGAQRARAELQALNETLEARVQDRTEALTTTNKQLRAEVEERRRAEAALGRANTMLEYRNRELQDFAYVASHDLQEPLRKVRSFAGILSDEYADRLGDGRPYLARIEDASERMIRLIRDLLAFSRVATQGQDFQAIDLTDVVREVMTDLEISLEETGGHVEIEPLCRLEADPMQMRQLFQNLIGNALKFHREGVPPEVRVRPGVTDEVCRIEVEDNGIGFDEKYLDRIFSPFQRLHARDRYPGTGMGLAICRRITERHGGTITAQSTPDVGTTFVITLPTVHRQEERQEERPPHQRRENAA